MNGIGGAVLRGVAAAGAALAVWQVPAVSHGYARAVAQVVRWMLALLTGRATRLVEAPVDVAPGLGVLVASSQAGADPVGLPLTWMHLTEVGVGVVVYAALLAAWGLWPASARPAKFAWRAGAAAAVVVLLQIIAISLVAWGSMPGGVGRAEQAGGLLESGATWVVPALAWAWVVWGGPGPAPAVRRRLPRR